MGIEYTLGKTGSGKYQQLKCDENSNAIVKTLSMYGFGDCIKFSKKCENNSTFGNNFGLDGLSCFKGLKSYERLIFIPRQDIPKLAARIYELLFMNTQDDKRYIFEPKIDTSDRKYQQILEELILLGETQARLIVSGDIVFPKISDRELAHIDSW
jgi:hypothetical protein